jgi:thiamine-phosphate diphosphorylase/hydroxyethylthiazole kinase
MWNKHSVDYSVYLVTDSTMLPPGHTFLQQVQESIAGGATLIQLREKSILTLDFIDKARQVHALTEKAGIPLIINDRVDVALAIDAEGIHVGQDDMPVATVRKLVGPHKLIGVTCSNKQETMSACSEGIADYIGMGTVYQTNTKKDVSIPDGCGPIGIREMLAVLYSRNSGCSDDATKIKCVAIGGINHSNAAKVMYQCEYKSQRLDGLAVVSCIMASEDARRATTEFAQAMDVSRLAFVNDQGAQAVTYPAQVRQIGPLVHHITNNVVKQFSANITLSIGASPIMSELGDEFEEFAAKVENLAFVLNLGTPSPEQVRLFKHAIAVYNKYGKPIVFDPVGAGASTARMECCRQLLNCGQVTVIKGNLGEVLTIDRLTVEGMEEAEAQKEHATLMRGVDSSAELSIGQIHTVAKRVAQNFKCIVVITGKTNYIYDTKFGDKVEEVAGGNKMMGSITGTGCSLGSTIASFLGCGGAQAESTVEAVKLYNAAGASVSLTSPGTFAPKFIDALYELTLGH